MNRYKSLIASIGLCLAVATPASALTLLSNLATATNVGTAFGPDTTTVTKDAGWTMGAQSYFLDQVTLDLVDMSAGDTIPSVSIWAGIGAPGTLVQTLQNPVSVADGNNIFTPAATLTLSASATYWLRVEDNSSTSPWTWNGRTSAPASSADATFVGYLFNGSSSTFLNGFSIDVSGTTPAVPLPATALLLGLALATLTRTRRRAA